MVVILDQGLVNGANKEKSISRKDGKESDMKDDDDHESSIVVDGSGRRAVKSDYTYKTIAECIYLK